MSSGFLKPRPCLALHQVTGLHALGWMRPCRLILFFAICCLFFRLEADCLSASFRGEQMGLLRIKSEIYPGVWLQNEIFVK